MRRNEALLKLMSEFLSLNGTEAFAKIISDAMDMARPNETTLLSINETRKNVAKKLLAYNELNLIER